MLITFERKNMEKQIYQIKIALKNSKPKIWRRLLIPSDLKLSDLHKVIQSSMGWTNSHLHQFIKNKTIYSKKNLNDDDLGFFARIVDYKKLKISDLLVNEKEKIVYEYDFGDSWNHDITLEKILPVVKSVKYPVCIAGKMHCPPEDCGGVWGYENLLEILKNPQHEEYEDMIEWLEDDEYDPEEFDIEEVNELLLMKSYGCFEPF